MRALLLAVAMALFPSSAWALSVGVVKMEAAMASTKHYQQVKARLETEQSKRQAVLDQKQAELEERRKAIEAKQAVSTPESLRPEQKKLMADAQALGQRLQMLQQELAQLEQKYTQQLLVRFQAVVRQIAEKKDLDYVFAGGTDVDPNVLFATPRLDVTDEVVELYREQYGDEPLELD